MLKNIGYKTETVQNGDYAVQRYKEEKFMKLKI